MKNKKAKKISKPRKKIEVKNLKKKLFNILAFTLCIAAVLSALFVPEMLLEKRAHASLGSPAHAPSEYYSGGSAVAKMASSKLTDEEKAQLILGEWERTISDVTEAEIGMSVFEAAELARAEIKRMNSAGEFETNFESGNGNWYSYKGYPKKAVDSTFNTYTVYFWELDFTKYDNSVVYHIVMSNEGNIIDYEVKTTEVNQ